jgi:hypothetical protein
MSSDCAHQQHAKVNANPSTGRRSPHSYSGGSTDVILRDMQVSNINEFDLLSGELLESDSEYDTEPLPPGDHRDLF